jgi:hypothetical protein
MRALDFLRLCFERSKNIILEVLHKVADRACDFLVFVCREWYEGLHQWLGRHPG